MLFDAFISHASEDKDELVRPLAQLLRDQHIAVWYDEFTLTVGSSLRRSIDRGLRESRFGIVVLSPSFFEKDWSQWELDGLVARQNSGEADLILPVWHNVGRDEVLAYSPPLADRLAVTSAAGLDEVARQLVSVIRPQGSTLVIARDHLITWGCDPPVISDDWWLDVAASADSNMLEGGWQESMGWGRWGFPLPPKATDPEDRGWRLANAAIQMMWQAEAESVPITQITPPEEVHDFIDRHPGLRDTCEDYPRFAYTYAPQLVLPGCGGPIEDDIEDEYQASLAFYDERRAEGHDVPLCQEELALRHPAFGGYDPSLVACGYVQGYAVINGPPVSYYERIEYIAWLLSEQSTWLPPAARQLLTVGMAEWAVWLWHRGDRRTTLDFGFEPADFTGDFAKELVDAKASPDFEPSEAAREGVLHRLRFSADLLGLPEDETTLTERLLAPAFLGKTLNALASRTFVEDDDDA